MDKLNDIKELLYLNDVPSKINLVKEILSVIDDVRQILVKASESFSDMTDGIKQGLGEIEGKANIKNCEEWVIPELFVQISYDLHSIYNELGGDMEDF